MRPGIEDETKSSMSAGRWQPRLGAVGRVGQTQCGNRTAFTDASLNQRKPMPPAEHLSILVRPFQEAFEVLALPIDARATGSMP